MRTRTVIRRPVRQRRRRHAFTLVEVLLAFAIFSMVIIAIYSSWSAIMRGTRTGLTAAAEVQRTRVAIRSLEESLGAAVMYADNPRYYGFHTDTTGPFAYLSFVSRLPESFPGSGLFDGESMRRVTFAVDPQKNLVLMQSSLLSVKDEPYMIQLAPKTAVFAVEFYNARMNEWLTEWISTNALPTMVRVAVDFGDHSTKETITIRTIPLTALAITRAGGAQPQIPGVPGNNNPAGPMPGPHRPPGSLGVDVQ